ncbi:MAG: hypothetical protein H7338_06685, partial [Candidatus Sericytochromatia bacterium]|nr:hypothetical protein [Candidatus Sericytochromatia bacterium]
DDFWGSVSGRIALDGNQFGPEALLGLAAFSHIEVVYHFHHVPEDRIERCSAPKAMSTSRTGRRS